jgi:quinol-cytochrome oxidoreductase complex cytochrome b subunit
VNKLENLGFLLAIGCALFVIFVVPYFDKKKSEVEYKVQV